MQALQPQLFYTARELVGVPKLPLRAVNIRRKAQREGWHYQLKQGNGGMRREYHIESLPIETQTYLLGQSANDVAPPPTYNDNHQQQPRIAPTPRTATTAELRFKAISLTHELISHGLTQKQAVAEVVRQENVAERSLLRWLERTKKLEPQQWLNALQPRYNGQNRQVHCSPEAWDFIKGDYLRPERPTFTACYRRLLRTAEANSWEVPSRVTLWRRLNRELPPAVITLAREGKRGLEKLYPSQTRNKSALRAMEAVNADGHLLDVFCKLPSGAIGRPMLVAIQDIYSGKLLSWRLAEAESAPTVRLAIGDMVENWGIPQHMYIDNGRAFASKTISGGANKRYRFKIKPEDPIGLLEQLGIKVHFTTPYHGQAKPIERAFRDLTDSIARHPKLAGAYTGNAPQNKPSNYGQRAVDWEVLTTIINAEITAHNAREGRRSAVCKGQSLDQAFAQSYAVVPIKKASVEQRRLWLLASQPVKVQRGGLVALSGNSYWTEALARLVGQRIIVRFDPQNLHDGVHAYRLDGGYVAHVPCTLQAGFADEEAAQVYQRERRRFLKAVKAKLAAEKRLNAAEVAQLLPTPKATSNPISKVIQASFKPHIGGDAMSATEIETAFNKAVSMMEA